jgi:hypothetical protein
LIEKESMRRVLQNTVSRLRRRLLPVLTVVMMAAAGLGWLACNAPFIPVPPPENIFIAQPLTDGSGKTVWITQGKPDSRAAGAKFYIFNDAVGSGVIVEAGADGTYSAMPLNGTMGDHVFLYYTTPAGVDSEVACRVLTEGDPAPHCAP